MIVNLCFVLRNVSLGETLLGQKTACYSIRWYGDFALHSQDSLLCKVATYARLIVINKVNSM